MNDGPIGPRQRAAFWSTGASAAVLGRRAARLRRSPRAPGAGRCRRVEVELDLVAVADHAVATDREAVPVDLEAVAQPRLHDAVARLDLGDQPVDVADEIVVDARQVVRRRRRRAAALRSPVPDRPAAPCDPARPGESARWAGCARSRARRAARGRSDVRAAAANGALAPARSCRTRRVVVGPGRRSAVNASTTPSTPADRADPRAWRQPVRRLLRVEQRWSSIRSLAAPASSGSLASLSAARNIVLSAPSGGRCAVVGGRISSPASIASSRSSTASSASAATTTVRPSQRCGTSDVDQRTRSASSRSASDHSSRPNSVDSASSASTIGKGPNPCSSTLEHGVDGLLDHFGDDQFVAVPHVREFGLGQRLGQFGALVEVPGRRRRSGP